MDSLKGFANQFSGGNNQTQGQSSQGQGQYSEGQQQQQGGGGGFFGGLGNKMNEAAGGGQASEKNEDYLDKGTHLSLQHPFVSKSQQYRTREWCADMLLDRN